MKVSTARLCIDCDELFDGDAKGFYRTICPSCTSKETVLLTKFLPAKGITPKEGVKPMRPESKGG